jgi:hypothetical protein
MEQYHFLITKEHVENPVGPDPNFPQLPFDLPEGHPSCFESTLSDIGECRGNHSLVIA